MLCEAPELWKTYHISYFGNCRYALWNARTMENVTYVMLWRPQTCSAKSPNYGKRTIFHALEAADELCEAPELWKTDHISCFASCRYALRSARTMGNVTYFRLWMPQICSANRPNYRKRIIFHALETADMLCEAPEPWET
jgi:hypothetical protein